MIALLCEYGFVVLVGAFSYCLVLGLLWWSLFGSLISGNRVDFELQKNGVYLRRYYVGSNYFRASRVRLY